MPPPPRDAGAPLACFAAMPLRSVARMAYGHRWLVLALFFVLLACAVAYGIGAPGALTTGGFEDPSSESARAERALDETFHAEEPDVVVVYSHPTATFRERAFADRLQPVLASLERRAEVQQLASPYGPAGQALVSNDGRAVIVTFHLAGDGSQKESSLARIEPLLRPPGLTTWVGGAVPADRQAQEAAARDLSRGEYIALPVVALLLIVFFRGVIAASLPLFVGGFAVIASMSWIRLIAGLTEVSIFAIDIVSFVGLGIAIDYSLFMTSRFREELARGRSVDAAIERSLATAGRTITYSGVIVAVSLLGLFAFRVVLLRSVAIAGLLVVAMALVATLLFLPAMLSVLGPRIEWLRIGRRTASRPGGHWQRLARAVMRAPVTITVLTTALLLALGAPFLRLNESVGGAQVLPKEAEARKVAEVLASGRFAATAASTIPIVVTTSERVLTRDGLGALARYVDRLAVLPGIERVDAIAGGPSGPSMSEVLAMRGALPAELASLARGRQTIVRVATSAPPGSDVQARLVDRIREISVPGVASAWVAGPTARQEDVRAAIVEGLPIALTSILVVTFVLLFFAFGSLVMPLKAIVMNTLSLTAGFGALVLIFQDGRLEHLLHFESTGAVDITVPVAMFAVLFGLSMDYELFLLSRIREEYDRVHDTTASIAFGIEQSGTIITRAALLLVAVMLGFVAADMLLIKELGVGMAIAIAVDVTIVRALLVPATMKLLGHYNWWAPRPLARLWERFGIAESA